MASMLGNSGMTARTMARVCTPVAVAATARVTLLGYEELMGRFDRRRSEQTTRASWLCLAALALSCVLGNTHAVALGPGSGIEVRRVQVGSDAVSSDKLD